MKNGSDILMRINEWITTIMEGMIREKSGRGRPRTPCIKHIIEVVVITTYNQLKLAVIHREEWDVHRNHLTIEKKK